MFKVFIRVFLIACFLSLTSLCLAYVYERDRDTSLAHYIMAVYYDDLGEVELAIREYNKTLRQDNEISGAHLNLAVSLIKKNDFSKAIEELILAAKFDPKAIEPHAVLALLYSLEKNPKLAAYEYELALKNASKLEPNNIDIYKELAAFYLKQKNTKEAENILRLISELSPQDYQVHYYLGAIYNELKNYVLSERELKKAIELKPDYAEALNFLGYYFVEQNKNLNDAERLIEKALRLDPHNAAYIDSLGWLNFKKGKFKQAKKVLEQASLILEDPVIFDHLGDACFKLNDISGAKLNWEKSLKRDPNQDSVKEKLKKMQN